MAAALIRKHVGTRARPEEETVDQPQFQYASPGDYTFYFDPLITVGIVPLHFWRGPSEGRLSRILLGIMLALWLLWFLSLGFYNEIRFRDVLLAVLCYSAVLFVFLSELLMKGGAAWLTKRRGEKWIKEIDYFYLALAAAGLAISIGQLQAVSDKISLPGTIGTLVLATAIVLRAIKTRADIGGWNRSEQPS
jgi:hypothetical protein